MRTLGSLIIFMALTIALIWSTGMEIGLIIDESVLLAYVAVLAGIITATGSFKTFISGINGVVSKKYRMTEELRDKALSLFKLLKKSTIHATVLITVLGLLATLYRMEDISKLGSAVAVALLSILYGAFINLALLNPAIYILCQKQEDDATSRVAKIKNRDKEAVEKLLQLCFEKGLTHDDIMAAEDITLRKG